MRIRREWRGRCLEGRWVPAAPDDTNIYPFAVAFSGDNTVYLADIWNNRVVVLTTH